MIKSDIELHNYLTFSLSVSMIIGFNIQQNCQTIGFSTEYVASQLYLELVLLILSSQVGVEVHHWLDCLAHPGISLLVRVELVVVSVVESCLQDEVTLLVLDSHQVEEVLHQEVDVALGPGEGLLWCDELLAVCFVQF